MDEKCHLSRQLYVATCMEVMNKTLQCNVKALSLLTIINKKIILNKMAKLFYTYILKFKDILVVVFSFGALLYHFHCLHNFNVGQVFSPMQNFKGLLEDDLPHPRHFLHQLFYSVQIEPVKANKKFKNLNQRFAP